MSYQANSTKSVAESRSLPPKDCIIALDHCADKSIELEFIIAWHRNAYQIQLDLRLGRAEDDSFTCFTNDIVVVHSNKSIRQVRSHRLTAMILI
jgi:hypothetical protein